MTSCFAEREVHLYWFSGAGNTLMAIAALAEEFRYQGVHVKLRSLEKSDPSQIDPKAVFGIAFPTHCFTLPELVRDFVLKLPQADGTPAFMLTTVGLLSGGVHGPLKKILTQKGFHCIGARQLIMPDSFFAFIHGKTAFRMIRSARRRARIYADRLLSGKTSWKRVPVLSDLYAAFWRWFFKGRNMIPSMRYPVVHAKEKLCIRCRRCTEMCPVGALDLHDPHENDAIPKPLMHCTLCLRCVAVCPTDAMRLRLMGLAPYRAEPSGELTAFFQRTLDENR